MEKKKIEKCQVKNHKSTPEDCGKDAKYFVRHRDSAEGSGFYVCEEDIVAYQYKIHPSAESNFIIKELSPDSSNRLKPVVSSGHGL